MGKKESTFINMTITLLLATIVAGVSLGYINDITTGPIAQAKLERKINAIKSVLPEFDNNPVEDIKWVYSEFTQDSVEVYTGYLNKSLTGTAVVGYSERGYGGPVKLMVGFSPDGTINDITVLEQKETPGLGTKIKGERFRRQFRGKHPRTYTLKVKKDQGDVDALTGATITTRAFTEATQSAYDVFEKNQPESEN